MDIYFADIKTPSGHTCDVVISALQKFIRRGEVEDAARAAYELLMVGGELTEYLWKRLMVISVEDVGMAEPMAATVISAHNEMRKQIPADSADYLTMVVSAVRYLCACPKDQGSCNLASVIKRRVRRGDGWELPDYVYDMHTKKGQEDGRDYTHFLSEASKVSPAADPALNPWRQELTDMIREGIV